MGTLARNGSKIKQAKEKLSLAQTKILDLSQALLIYCLTLEAFLIKPFL